MQTSCSLQGAWRTPHQLTSPYSIDLHQGTQTNSKAETSGWTRPFLGSLAVPTEVPFLGRRTGFADRRRQICFKCSFWKHQGNPRDWGIETQLPVGAVKAPGRNAQSSLEGQGGEPCQRQPDTVDACSLMNACGNSTWSHLVTLCENLQILLWHALGRSCQNPIGLQLSKSNLSASRNINMYLNSEQ